MKNTLFLGGKSKVDLMAQVIELFCVHEYFEEVGVQCVCAFRGPLINSFGKFEVRSFPSANTAKKHLKKQ
jgi:hypothetical protein